MASIFGGWRPRLTIASRFWIALGALTVSLSVLSAFGFTGLGRLHAGAGDLRRVVTETSSTYETRTRISDVRAALQANAIAEGGALVEGLHARVESALIELRLNLSAMRDGPTAHPGDARETILQQRQLAHIGRLWRSGALDRPAGGAATGREERRMLERIQQLVQPMIDASNRLAAHDRDAARTAAAHATRDFRYTRSLMAAVSLATMLLGLSMILWLIRAVVPRARCYSRFASRVSGGELDARLDPRGGDELDDLGRSLNHLVARHEAERDYQITQGEYADAMQATESEDEADELIRQHIERSIAGSAVVVLSTNNSEDRLEPRTRVELGSALAQGLDGAKPRSCLAVRFARPHKTWSGAAPLLACEVCGKSGDMVTCKPLLVGGSVIGSVLTRHPEPLTDRGDARIRDSVSQAGPVLGNLRNLAVAESRAATDALTGLPNNRAVNDTVRRMAAQASRAQSPLAAAMLDLDHFKQINDTYGHGRGDEVLAAVGAALRSAVRESDFVGRYGGEEFLLLLPDTDVAGAARAAETVRAAIAQISLPGLDRAITASIGVAVMPDHAIDVETLVRNADRALYAAKTHGRNRVELAGSGAGAVHDLQAEHA